MKLCIAYMMYSSTRPHFAIDNFLTKIRSFLTFCDFFGRIFKFAAERPWRNEPLRSSAAANICRLGTAAIFLLNLFPMTLRPFDPNGLVRYSGHYLLNLFPIFRRHVK